MANFKIGFINANYRRFAEAHKEELQNAIWDCISKGRLTLREDVWEFEKSIAEFVGAKYCASVNSGTDALFLSLKALGIGSGDSVITVSHTFIATIQAIVNCGARPILVDVRADDELMNVEKLESAIEADTKAIIPVQYTGAVCDMEAIQQVAQKHNFFIVDDFCQALGAEYDFRLCRDPSHKENKHGCQSWGRTKAGNFGVLNAVSFNVAKMLGGMTDGGAVTTNDCELYEKICLLRNHWNVHQLSVDRNDYPQPEEVHWAWKSRLANVNAAFLNVKFKTLSWILGRRKEIAMRYGTAFSDLYEGFVTPEDQKNRVWQEYHLKVLAREKFASYLAEQGIETLTRDVTPNHKMKGLGLEQWNLPVTEELARCVIRLPLYEYMTDDEVGYVIEKVRAFYGK